VPASGDSENDCGEIVECRVAGETEELGENLPQCRGGKPATNRLSYGVAEQHW
jgi:hypothetical protein